MPDIATISAAITSLKNATDIAKLIKDSGTTLEKAEIKMKLAELISALADAKLEVSDLKELLVSKDEEIRKLQESQDMKKHMVWEKPYYWNMQSGEKDGPFCQQCFNSDNKLIRLQTFSEGHWKCLACKNSFFEDDYRPPRVVRRVMSAGIS
ncbi:hypothetical protein [Photobacterium halotolerans]|uniref:hypothetical protein n=1 Tax=Photobacterium halotolerans TaxID=265726 RepID=UPI001373421E|nr:hypothetical protein [Photobacterium halotolerans]NAW88783.1 hypothetical protein [Photobacterium halotolerans]